MLDQFQSNNDEFAEFISLLAQLRACRRTLSGHLARQVDPHGINETQFFLLWQCKQTAAGISQRELARSLSVSPAQISGMVEQLRAGGLLAGHRPPRDRRRQLWQLTEKGEKLLNEITERLRPWASQVTSQFDELRRRELIGTLDGLAQIGELTQSDGADSGHARLERGAA